MLLKFNENFIIIKNISTKDNEYKNSNKNLDIFSIETLN